MMADDHGGSWVKKVGDKRSNVEDIQTGGVLSRLVGKVRKILALNGDWSLSSIDFALMLTPFGIVSNVNA